MIEARYLELIQADVDGELPERERGELARYLLANPEARSVRDDLRRLCGVLDRVPAVEPPADLKASILAGVRLPPERRSGMGGPGGSGVSPRILRYAAALAGAVLVSALAFQIGLDREPGVALTEVAGTMARQGHSDGQAPTGAISVSLDQVTGRVSLYASPTSRVLEFDLAAGQPVEVVVSYDGREERVGPFGASRTGGSQHSTLVLDGPAQAGAAIHVRFLSSGALIHEDTIEVPESDRGR